MAKIERLPSGLYRTRVYIGRTPEGKIKTKSLTHKDKRTLARMAAAYADLHREVKDPESFQHCADAYISAREAILSPSTIRGYKSMLKALKSEYGRFCAENIHDFGQRDLQDLVDDMARKKKSSKTISNRVGFINSVLVYAGAHRLTVQLPQRTKVTYSIPDTDMARRIASDVSGKPLEVPVLLGMLGLRRSEICALELSDLDGSTLHIHSAVVYASGGKKVKKAPKTTASDRYVVIPDSLADKIRSQGYITKMNPNSLTKAWERLIKKGKYPPIRFHDLRHFFVSYANNILHLSDAQIMKMGGWATSAVMRSVYLQSMEDEKASQSVSTFMSTITEKVDTECVKVDTQ